MDDEQWRLVEMLAERDLRMELGCAQMLGKQIDAADHPLAVQLERARAERARDAAEQGR